MCQKTLPALDEYQPEQKYFLLDVVRLLKESIADERNLSAMLFRMEQCKTIEELIEEIKKARVRLSGEHYEEFRLLLSQWIRYTVLTQYTDTLSTCKKLT